MVRKMDAIDPICKMSISVNDRTPRLEDCESGTRYFCSDECRLAFKYDPAIFYQACHN